MMKGFLAVVLWGASGCSAAIEPTRVSEATQGEPLFHDAHFHLTNYVQEGLTAREYLEHIMGNAVGRSTLFGIPLQQMWSYENSGDFAPTYYLQTDAPLYYYSFTDAVIAREYLSLSRAEQRRLDPMITGFNPADMYGVDHIRRVLRTFPGVFTGIGEFTIHKEFVSSKVAGEVASLRDPALDRILDFAGDVGLVVILHNDIDVPFGKGSGEPVFLKEMVDLLRRHPDTTIIWAHTGLGRVVAPRMASGSAATGQRPRRHLEILASLLGDPKLRHVYFDISWDELAKYAVSTAKIAHDTAELFNRYPDRFLFGTDTVAPKAQATQLDVFRLWAPVFADLTPAASEAIRLRNYERLFDTARERVRDWERKHSSKR